MVDDDADEAGESKEAAPVTTDTRLGCGLGRILQWVWIGGTEAVVGAAMMLSAGLTEGSADKALFVFGLILLLSGMLILFGTLLAYIIKGPSVPSADRPAPRRDDSDTTARPPHESESP